MSEVHEPTQHNHDVSPASAAAMVPPPHPRIRGKSLLTIGLEVSLITAGVFLGLMGEQWRERSEQRELAQTSLQRFRTEIANNRKAVAAVSEYHATLREQLDAYFKLKAPRDQRAFGVRMTRGLGPVFFEQAAWDLALATQSLAHIDSELAFALSRVYTIQQGYAGAQGAILSSTVYARSMQQDFEGYWTSILYYVSDLAYFDPTILKAYDEVLVQIDRALGDSPAQATAAK